MEGSCENILNKQSRIADGGGGGPPAWGLGGGLTTPHRKSTNLLRIILQSLGPGRILWILTVGGLS
jgi:hypothetical protein